MSRDIPFRTACLARLVTKSPERKLGRRRLNGTLAKSKCGVEDDGQHAADEPTRFEGHIKHVRH